jgi:hypothetical protein
MRSPTRLKPPVSLRATMTAEGLYTDANALDRAADHADPNDAEKLLALGRRLRRHADTLTATGDAKDQS